MAVRVLQLGALFGAFCLWLIDDGEEIRGTLLLSGLLSFLVVMGLEWLRLNRALETLTGVLKRAAEPIPPRAERGTRGLGFFLSVSMMSLMALCAGVFRNWSDFDVANLGADSLGQLIAILVIAFGALAGLVGLYSALLLRLLAGAWTLKRFEHASRHLGPKPDYPTPIPGLLALAATPLALLFWLDHDPAQPALNAGSSVLIFELGPDDTIGELDPRLVALGPTRVHDFIPNDSFGLNQQYTLRVSARDKDMALDLLKADDENVDWAEPASMAQIPESQGTGDCRISGQSWGPTNDPYSKHQHSLSRTELIQLMNRTPLLVRSPTRVAVVDLGIDGSHPDLRGVVSAWGTGSSHGTAVAGVLAAPSNNRIGITSSNLDGKRIRLLDHPLSGARANSGEIADAITEAVNDDAQVINLSLAGQGAMPRVVAEALDYAEQQGVLVVAAAGNTSSTVHWPARYPSVLSVASTDSEGRGSAFNGADADLRAPGQAVCTTLAGGGYGTQNGTSLAAPYVSGVAASLLYLCPKASPPSLRAGLIDTASQREVRADQAFRQLFVQGHCTAF